jgi:PleD family two-component response regulator
MHKYLNILVAENSEVDYLSLLQALHAVSPKFNVKRAKDGLECLRLLKDVETPNLVFLNLELPFIQGLECLRYIKSHSRFSHIPVVINASSFYIKNIDVAFREGAHYYMVKPAELSTQKMLVEILFDRLTWGSTEVSKQNFVLKESNILREQYV